MKDYVTQDIRNIGLFGHGGSGKTSLAEAMLFTAGAVNRLGSVDQGTTVSDFDPDEVRRKISVNATLLPFEWAGRKVNLIDTPGYADFIAEVRQSLRVVDSVVVLIDAVSGVEVGSELMWQYAEEMDLPKMVYVGKMDRENANFERALAAGQGRFGNSLVALQVPIGAAGAFQGVVDVLEQKAYIGDDKKGADVPAELKDAVAAARTKVIEAVAELDDDLTMKYLEGEELTADEIMTGLRKGVAERKVVPVFCGAPTANKGIVPFLNSIAGFAPTPLDRTAEASLAGDGETAELKADPKGVLAALVFKTTADPYVGRLTYLRVYSGTFHSDAREFNCNRGEEERIGQLLFIRGKTQEPVTQLVAGDLGGVAKLAVTTTGDTLCDKAHLVTLPGITFPRPVYSASIEPKTKADLDKLGPALARMVEEDPSLVVEKNPDTGETLLSGMGESHVDITVERMHRKFGVEVEVKTPTVPYKETITIPSRAQGRFKRQTGGRGQFGDVWLELDPLPRSAGFEFADKVVGGSVPRNFIPAVEKGIVAALDEGILAGNKVVDVRVALVDGSYHPVDSSDMAFRIAGSMGFKKAAEAAKPVLLEPIMKLTVTVPDQYMGDVIGDLNSKRARVHGMTPNNGTSEIDAEAPLAEVQRYATDLRSMTQGRGLFKMEFSHYEEVPSHVAEQIIAAHKKKVEAEQAAR